MGGNARCRAAADTVLAGRNEAVRQRTRVGRLAGVRRGGEREHEGERERRREWGRHQKSGRTASSRCTVNLAVGISGSGGA